MCQDWKFLCIWQEDKIRYSIESSLIRYSNKVNCQVYKKPNVSRLESDILLTLLKVPDREDSIGVFNRE